jgi:hypothetical protein
MTDSSRAQGGLICVAVVILATLFLAGLLRQSYWALAVPVAALVLFVLGLSFWVGWTIATVAVEPEPALDSDRSGEEEAELAPLEPTSPSDPAGTERSA